MPHADARLALIHDWLTHSLKLQAERIEPASADASFRRYFRVLRAQDAPLVVMDAPPQKEDVRPYLKVSHLLAEIGVHVPKVYEADTDRGLLLLEDLGTVQYLTPLQAAPERADALYGDALDALADIQLRGLEAAEALGPYDREALAREMALMPEWFCQRHLGFQLSGAERDLIARTEEFLITAALAQPQVFVHRDFHSRNLMLMSERNPGILDFQDALRGPVGYDLVSLLKDCYISWPRGRVESWVAGYRRLLLERGADSPSARALAGASDAEFLRWFDLIGVQRHIKVLGIFARLWYRDGKRAYLHDLPLTLNYVREACGLYEELRDFARFLEERVVPELPRANARVFESKVVQTT